jgi:hypothetical protein
MNHVTGNLKGRSFRWAFVVFIVLFLLGPFGYTMLGFTAEVAAILLGLSGFVPFLIQAITGYSLSNTWVAEFSRVEDPRRYWLLLALSVLLAMWGAYHMYADAVDVAS